MDGMEVLRDGKNPHLVPLHPTDKAILVPQVKEKTSNLRIFFSCKSMDESSLEQMYIFNLRWSPGVGATARPIDSEKMYK
jgi:hypothetical protein